MADDRDDVGSVETAPVAESDLQQLQQHQEEEEEAAAKQQKQGEEEGGGQEEKEKPPPPSNNEVKKSPEKIGGTISFSIWPPSQRTRDAVINRLIETLSNPSALSKRYGSIPHDEASSLARQIEKDSFSAASETATSLAGDDGIEILQGYSKEISKRMLDAVKARSSSTASDSSASTTDHNASSLAPLVSATGASEETSSSVEAES